MRWLRLFRRNIDIFSKYRWKRLRHWWAIWCSWFLRLFQKDAITPMRKYWWRHFHYAIISITMRTLRDRLRSRWWCRLMMWWCSRCFDEDVQPPPMADDWCRPLTKISAFSSRWLIFLIDEMKHAVPFRPADVKTWWWWWERCRHYDAEIEKADEDADADDDDYAAKHYADADDDAAKDVYAADWCRDWCKCEIKMTWNILI